MDVSKLTKIFKIILGPLWDFINQRFSLTAPKICITLPHHDGALLQPLPLANGEASYLVEGTLNYLPPDAEVWLLTKSTFDHRYWPQGFFQVKYNPDTRTWHGRVCGAGGTGLEGLTIVAVVAPPTSQLLFRYYEKVGRETSQFIAIDGLPPEIVGKAEVNTNVKMAEPLAQPAFDNRARPVAIQRDAAETASDPHAGLTA